MAERRAMSKKLRFEVFKRDSFTCLNRLRLLSIKGK